MKSMPLVIVMARPIREIYDGLKFMLEIKLIGLGCSKSWKMEDRLLKDSRELGIPVQIVKVMELDSILQLNLQTIPVLAHDDNTWNYDHVMQAGNLRQILMDLHNDVGAL